MFGLLLFIYINDSYLILKLLSFGITEYNYNGNFYTCWVFINSNCDVLFDISCLEQKRRITSIPSVCLDGYEPKTRMSIN